jgi:hypothetical protein
MLLLLFAEFFGMVHVRCDVHFDAFVSLFAYDVSVLLICFLLELLHSLVNVVILKLLVQYLPASC